MYLTITSEDVIHSFWVPKLAGKQDVIPTGNHNLKLIADQPGVYEGQCAEFCAISHANMRPRVIAQTPADFDIWVRGQLAPAPQPPDAQIVDRFLQHLRPVPHAPRDRQRRRRDHRPRPDALREPEHRSPAPCSS